MPKAIVIHEFGGPEVLRWEDVEVGEPRPGQVRVRHTAVGLNFIDVYHRTGLYPLELPLSLGTEAAGVVDEVGPGVTELAVGDRVAYAGGPPGAYAERRVMPTANLVRLPDAIDDRTAASMMLKGMTAQYLLRRTHRVEPGEVILVQAAAGGVGMLLCQWAAHLGATVIGTVGSDEKAELAKAHGCAHPVVRGRESFVDRVMEVTDGKGVPVVYDSVGKDTFADSMASLAPRGHLVSFGQSSGKADPIAPIELGSKSLSLTRPTLAHYVGTREELEETAADLFDVVVSGTVTVNVNQIYPLAETARAHRDLEARRTTGSTVLTP
ncbi:MAG: zinc-binding dehydrogenase [Nitriliruptorales bacterium]|nr:zinc-binding dehydrogenase [Nitriliruptorales bacterium]